jgi:transitional endoplasmic reticulum ATPase
MEDLTLLFERYERYYKHALKAQANHAKDDAKQNFTKAAEVMYEISQKSPKNLKQIRLEKAKTLIEIAEKLESGTVKSIARKDEVESKKFNPIINKQKVTFDDLIGLEDAKTLVRTQMILPFKYPEKYATYRKSSGGGLILYGPPGTGKTTFAKAIANEIDASFFVIKGSDIKDKFVGESEKNIASLFASAIKEERAVIFIDDLDSLFLRRGLDHHNDERLNEFLQNMDGFQGRHPHILLLGTTNRPWALDSAIVRPGRFSRQIYIPLPNEQFRIAMLEKFLQETPADENLDLKWIASQTEHYSGADIEELCEQAKVYPLMKYIETDTIYPITNDDFNKALQDVKSVINANELERFDTYSRLYGVHDTNKADKGSHSLEEKSPAKQNENLLVDHDRIIHLSPDEPTTIRFILKNTIEDHVYIKLNSNRYTCSKDLSLWSSDPIDLDQAGVFTVTIYHREDEIAMFDVEFVRGVVVHDMGI